MNWTSPPKHLTLRFEELLFIYSEIKSSLFIIVEEQNEAQ